MKQDYSQCLELCKKSVPLKETSQYDMGITFSLFINFEKRNNAMQPVLYLTLSHQWHSTFWYSPNLNHCLNNTSDLGSSHLQYLVVVLKWYHVVCCACQVWRRMTISNNFYLLAFFLCKWQYLFSKQSFCKSITKKPALKCDQKHTPTILLHIFLL